MNKGYFQGLWDDEPSEERLPNGYTRKDYYDNGFTDFDIEYWGDGSARRSRAIHGWLGVVGRTRW